MDYFPNKNEYLDKFKRLSDEQFGRLIRAAMLYNTTGEAEVEEDIGLAFDCIVSDINKAKEAYLHKCEINASNGAKGGRPKKLEESERLNEKPKKANGFLKTEKSQINKNKNKEKENINTLTEYNGAKGGRPKKLEESERLNEKPKKANGFLKTEKSQINKNKNKEKENINTLTEYKEPETALEIALGEFKQYRKEMKKPLTPLAETKLMNQLQTLSNGDEAVMVQIIDQSIRNGWQGVFPLKDQKTIPWQRKPAFDYQQRQQTDDEWTEMEKRILVNLDED